MSPSLNVHTGVNPHWLFETSQYSPVVLSQLELPHAQFDGLAVSPSVWVQATKRHELMEASQKSPVPAVQSAVPQVQLPELAVRPSLLVHVGVSLQRSLETSQYWVSVQSTAPQAQSPEFGAVPSVVVHTGPVKAHIQCATIEQSPSALSRVFRYLYLDVSKHPRGDSREFVVRRTPVLVRHAPGASFVTISYLFDKHVPEVTRGYTVTCAPGSLLHVLLEASQKSPVVAVQVAVPQAQFAVLFAVPSLMAHVGVALHVLLKASQYWVASQVAVPHTHLSELAAVPSVLAHVGGSLHGATLETSQYWMASQVAVPHTHLSELAAVPFVMAHVGVSLHLPTPPSETSQYFCFCPSHVSAPHTHPTSFSC